MSRIPPAAAPASAHTDRYLSVALVQAVPHAADAPLDRFAAHARSVLAGLPSTAPAARLLVYPETHLFGDLADQAERAEPLDGPRLAGLRSLAAELGVWLIPGTLVERGTDGLYNTAVVLSPDGELVASYRKCFPWRPYEPYRPGTAFSVFEMPGVGRVGLSICYDTWFPEIARQLAWLGAELIVTPTRTTTSDREQEIVLTRAAAIANQVYVLSCNTAAPTGVGRSMVVDPEGRVRVRAGRTPETVTDVVDLADVHRVRAYGTAGLNRVWDQFVEGDPPLPLPAYQGHLDPRTWHPGTRHPETEE